MAGQIAYHLMTQAGMTRAPWAITTVVSCLPVLVLGMGTALARMLRADAAASADPQAEALEVNVADVVEVRQSGTPARLVIRSSGDGADRVDAFLEDVEGVVAAGSFVP